MTHYTIKIKFNSLWGGFYAVVLDEFGDKIFETEELRSTDTEARQEAEREINRIIARALATARGEMGGAA
jgi:hypothetical protein